MCNSKVNHHDLFDMSNNNIPSDDTYNLCTGFPMFLSILYLFSIIEYFKTKISILEQKSFFKEN